VADLLVNLDLLEQTAGELSVLIEEFGNASAIVSSSSDAVGDPDLVAALEEFAGDWRVHREQLLSSMDAVHQMADKSHRAYIETDDKLAQQLRGDGGR
jgi:hypothetical protein